MKQISKIFLTGSNGFIGRNVVFALKEDGRYQLILHNREEGISSIENHVNTADFVLHLGGVNRTNKPEEFFKGNADFTSTICEAIKNKYYRTGIKTPILFSSSIQAEQDNSYGRSKLLAEESIKDLEENIGIKSFIYRLPNVFGKWSKVSHNSVVATFAYKISRDQKIDIIDPNKSLNIIYIDDVVRSFLEVLSGSKVEMDCYGYVLVEPIYIITVNELAEKLKSFRAGRKHCYIDRVGLGLERALYSTYLSYLDKKEFSYIVRKHEDERGYFAEILKTKDSGQFSIFTAKPGITRGGHYHHIKSEKFIIVKGIAKFKFVNILTNDKYEIITSSEKIEVVESIPGWAHAITNIGGDELIGLLWANEVFDKSNPDTYTKLMGT